MGLSIEKKAITKIEFSAKDDVVYLSGSIDNSNSDTILAPLFEEAHNQIIKSKMTKVNLNITSVSYMNSSAMKALVNWILKLNTLPDASKYTINFICSSNFEWQEPRVNMLELINKKYVTKEFK